VQTRFDINFLKDITQKIKENHLNITSIAKSSTKSDDNLYLFQYKLLKDMMRAARQIPKSDHSWHQLHRYYPGRIHYLDDTNLYVLDHRMGQARRNVSYMMRNISANHTATNKCSASAFSAISPITPPLKIFVTYKSIESIPPDVIQNISRQAPGTVVKVFGDNECYDFLKNYYSVEYADFFISIPDGPIRADFWRACIIFKFGGIYMDIDTVLLVPLCDFLMQEVDMCTSGSRDGCVNPIILFARSPGSMVLRKCIDSMFAMKDKPYSYWSYSICWHLWSVLKNMGLQYNNMDGVYTLNDGTTLQLLKENDWTVRTEASTSWQGRKVLRNHSHIYENHTFVV
jgi:mannosyltransferase OCH1-like enzyme